MVGSAITVLEWGQGQPLQRLWECRALASGSSWGSQAPATSRLWDEAGEGTEACHRPGVSHGLG